MRASAFQCSSLLWNTSSKNEGGVSQVYLFAIKQQQHPFNGSLSGTTQVRKVKGETNLDFIEARDSEWQWRQLSHMHICTSPQTDNTAAPQHSVFYRPNALPVTQPTALNSEVNRKTNVRFTICTHISTDSENLIKIGPEFSNKFGRKSHVGVASRKLQFLPLSPTSYTV